MLGASLAIMVIGENALGVSFVAFPLLVLAAWRFQLRGAAPVGLLVSAVAIHAAVHGYGTFAGHDLIHTMVILQPSTARSLLPGSCCRSLSPNATARAKNSKAPASNSETSSNTLTAHCDRKVLLFWDSGASTRKPPPRPKADCLGPGRELRRGTYQQPAVDVLARAAGTRMSLDGVVTGCEERRRRAGQRSGRIAHGQVHQGVAGRVGAFAVERTDNRAGIR